MPALVKRTKCQTLSTSGWPARPDRPAVRNQGRRPVLLRALAADEQSLSLEFQDWSRPTLGFLVHDVARLMRKQLERHVHLAKVGLTRAQWQVLAYVARSEGISQVTLARLLNIKPATLVYLIDRLEAAGLVERRVDPRDRRQRNLFMTRRAWSELARMGRLTTEVWEQALAGMDEAEREHLIAMLAVVKANLQAAASTLTLSDDSV